MLLETAAGFRGILTGEDAVFGILFADLHIAKALEPFQNFFALRTQTA